jgi:hypothetical protein
MVFVRHFMVYAAAYHLIPGLRIAQSHEVALPLVVTPSLLARAA